RSAGTVMSSRKFRFQDCQHPPVKFWIPHAADDEAAERIYASIKAFATETTGWQVTNRRIQRVQYQHPVRRQGELRTEWWGEVGKTFEFTHELCVAILETPSSYLVCTQNRGVAKGEPVLIGTPYAIVDFDD